MGDLSVENHHSDVDRDPRSSSFLIRKLNKEPLLTRAEEVELIQKARNNCAESEKTLIERNILLCYKIGHQFKTPSVGLDDLVQEGIRGLSKAIEKFDLSTGLRFGTYAGYWIRQKMILYINNTKSNVRIPINTSNVILKIKKAKRALKVQGKELTAENIAKQAEITVKKYKIVEKYMAIRVESLDADIMDGDDSSHSKEAVVEDYADDRMRKAEDIKSIKDCIEDLFRDREREIMVQRYGLDGQGKRTLEVISHEFNLSRERIRQIEDACLRKMRLWLIRNKRV
jgi:RNA polymerase primary sigma factor